jgi:hypothetical protein
LEFCQFFGPFLCLVHVQKSICYFLSVVTCAQKINTKYIILSDILFANITLISICEFRYFQNLSMLRIANDIITIFTSIANRHQSR